MREMKQSGVYWIGEIPEDWSLLPTKRFFRAEKRIVGDAVDEYERLALTMQGVIKRSKEDSEGLQPEKFEGYQILKKNELVFKLIDLENVKTSRVGLSPYTGLVSPAYIILTNDQKDNRFFYYWFMFMYYNEVFNQLGGAGVRSALNASDVCALPVPAIDYETQRRLADYLETKCTLIDSIIAKEEEIIGKLIEYKNSILDEIVLQEGIKCNLGLISNMKNGLNFSDTAEGQQIQFLGVGDFKNNYFLDNQDMFSSIITADEVAEDYLLKDGDIVFVRSNGSKELVGRAVMVKNINYPLTYSGFCIRFRNIRKDIIDDEFLLYFFRSPYFRKQLEKNSQGSNINNVNQDLLSNLSFVIPNIEYQKNAVKEIRRKNLVLDCKIANGQKLIEKLKEYKKSLIYEVVTGKKEV